MIIRSVLLTLAMLAASMVCVAQESSSAPFKIEIKGDTIEAVTFKAVATRELRNKTAREAALEFTAAFAQDSEAPEHKALREKCDALIAEFLQRIRRSVMDEALVAKLEAVEKADKERQARESGAAPSRKTGAFAVISEEKQADGRMLVTMERFTEVTNTDKDGKTTVARESEQQRVLCVKTGDGWAIEKHEAFKVDWSAESERGKEPSKTWQVQDTLRQWMSFSLAFGKLDIKVDNAGAEGAARGVLEHTGGFAAEFALFFHFVGKMAPAILEVVKPLFTPESWKAAEAEAKADHEKREKEKVNDKEPRAIEKHEKPEAGVETFLFAPQNDWSGKHWLKMKKTDKGWRCVEAKKFIRKQRYDKDGKMTESWDEKPIEKFADLDW